MPSPKYPISSTSKESARHIKAVLKALDVLDCFCDEPSLSLSELSRKTGLYRSRIIRIIGTLELRGYLLRTSDSNVYTAGPRLMILGKCFERNNNLTSLARPILRNLADRTGELSSLFIRVEMERMVLVREEGNRVIRMASFEGQRMPLYAGAGGKVLLAFGSEKIKNYFIHNKELTKLSPNTITDPKRLAKEIDTIRKHGYAVSFGERESNAGAVAAPVFGADNQIVAALGIGGPMDRFQPDGIQRLMEDVVASARKLSRHLGYIEKSPKSDDIHAKNQQKKIR